MKRLIMALVMAGVMVSMCACGNRSNDTYSDVSEAEAVQTQVTDAVGDDRAKFQVLPEEANCAFNTVINAAKTVCPPEKGYSRQYGYKGKEKLGDVECYLFSVYDFDKDNSSVKVGDFAKAVNDELVYMVSDSGLKEIELLPDEYTLTLSKKSDSAQKLIENAANLAAQLIIAG